MAVAQLGLADGKVIDIKANWLETKDGIQRRFTSDHKLTSIVATPSNNAYRIDMSYQIAGNETKESFNCPNNMLLEVVQEHMIHLELQRAIKLYAQPPPQQQQRQPTATINDYPFPN